MTRFVSHFVLVIAIGAGLYLGWQRAAQNRSPAQQFVKMFGEPVSLSCTQLILGAYKSNLQAEEIEREVAEQNPSVKEMLKQAGDDEKMFLFKNKEIHEMIAAEIRSLPKPEGIEALRLTTPRFSEILAKSGNAFYSVCEGLFLTIFSECKSQSSNPKDIQSCFNSRPQQSAKVRELFQSI